jgi:hypothetical protein
MPASMSFTVRTVEVTPAVVLPPVSVIVVTVLVPYVIVTVFVTEVAVLDENDSESVVPAVPASVTE